MIVEEINGLQDICSQHTNTQFKEVLKTKTNLSDCDVEAALSIWSNLHASCSLPLSTKYTREQFFHKNFSYVHPQRIYLGTDENRRARYAQYIPVKETLKALLKDPGVWQECLKPQKVPPTSVLTLLLCSGSN